MLKDYELKMRMTETGYSVLEFNDKDRMDFMEKLGIRLEGIHEAYMAALNSKPADERRKFSVDNWDRLLSSPDSKDADALMGMLDSILSTSDKKGKEHFLKVLRAMHGEGSETLDENMEEGKVNAMIIYRIIKGEVRDREIGYAMNADKKAEWFAKIEGETLGDKATRYVKGAVNMLVGPGQSWANRGAGLILLVAALKAGHAAYKGDTKMGKALRLLFVAGAAELATKEITGKGILERFGFETLMEAGEGSSEAVLVMDGAEHMHNKTIGPEEHTRALYELQKVSFRDAMAWYMDPNTNRENGMVSEDKDDKFPDGIDLDNIVFGEKWKNTDPEKAGRKILMQTMKHFFEYTGRKEGRSHQETADMLNDRWITSLKPNYKPKYSTFTPPQAFLDEYKKKPDELSWGMVIDMEISQAARNETIGKHGAQPTIDYFTQKAGEFVEWGRQTILSPATIYARRFGETLGTNKDKFINFVDKMAEKGKTKIHFGIEGAKLKWEEHEIEIRQFFGSNVELIWEGVKFFPSAIIGLNQWAVPGLLTKLKQGKEILFADDISVISGETLDESDIISGDKLLMLNKDFANKVRIEKRRNTKLTPEEAIEIVKNRMSDTGIKETRLKALDNPNALIPKNNPSFKHFGIYQKPFMKAMEAKGDPVEIAAGNEKPKPMFYINDDLTDKHVGYLITETTQGDADIMKYGEDDVRARYSKMAVAARKQAVDYFLGQNYNLTPKQVEDMMYPIHVAVKSDEYPPKIRYTFWRMPMPGGKEFELRENGHWADSKVPNKYRHPFYVDPGKSSFDNFVEAYGVDSPNTRKTINFAKKLVGRVGGLAMGASERLGKMADWVTNIFKKQGQPDSVFFEQMATWTEPNKQLYDEVSGLAGEPMSARSELYGDPEHAAMYNALRDLAIITGSSYYYGIIPNRPATNWDNPQPTGWTQENWEEYYSNWLFDNGYNEDGTRKGDVAGARERRGKKGRKGKGKGKKNKGKKGRKGKGKGKGKGKKNKGKK